MFSLIIALVAIALVAVLAGASVYYGTSAWSNNQSKAKYAEIVNQSEQISNAFLAFKINGNELDPSNCSGGASGSTTGCLQQLIDAKYLTSVPVGSGGTGWTVDENGSLYTTTSDPQACILSNEAKGYYISNFPLHDDVTVDGIPDSDAKEDASNEGAVCVEE
jgi:hypothetical protein